MRRWSYIIQEATVGLIRNLWMTVAVVLVVTVCLALFGASVLLSKQLEQATDDWVGKIEVSMYLCDGVDEFDQGCPAITEGQQASLRGDIEANPLVQEVFFESKQDAYDNFQEYYSDLDTMSETLAPEDLPASFRIKLVDPNDAAVITSQYEARPGVFEITDQQDVIDRFLSLAGVVRRGALVIAIIQMLAATALVANTVRVAAVARRDQTQIMKLVGASNWYVRLPFILEGVLAGLLGALVAWGLLAFLIPTLLGSVQDSLSFVRVLTTDQVLGVWPWLLFPGLGITGISSTLALWGFLDI